MTNHAEEAKELSSIIHLAFKNSKPDSPPVETITLIIEEALNNVETQVWKKAITITEAEPNLPGPCPPDMRERIQELAKDWDYLEKVIRVFSGGMQEAIVRKLREQAQMSVEE